MTNNNNNCTAANAPEETHETTPSVPPQAPQTGQGGTLEALAVQRRLICSRCDRPSPRACICQGLPVARRRLQRCRVLVLQHPHEQRRKNRSLPLMELCLHPDSWTTVVSRRFGDQCPPAAMNLLHDASARVLLLFPNTGTGNAQPVWSLSQARDHCISMEKDGTHDAAPPPPTSLSSSSATARSHKKIVVLVLDATWKYAQEMDQANIRHQQYPPHMVRVALSWDDPLRPPQASVPLRFDIRRPPLQQEENHAVHYLSTAECIAWVLEALEPPSEEEDESLYAVLMKPLDCMVKKWHECHREGSKRNDRGDDNKDRRGGNNDEDPQRNLDPAVTRTSFFTQGDDLDHNQKRNRPKKKQKLQH